MNEKDTYKDNFLKGILKDVALEEPSGQFTKKVMDRVMQEWLTKPVAAKKTVSRKRWFGLTGIALLLTLIFLATDVRTIIQMLDHPVLNQIDDLYLQPIYTVFAQLFYNITHLPVIVYIILAAVMFLSLLDRFFLKRLQYK